jgi:endonuclease/exonuclease/phosphatase (EEP) superfamily protein YafD
VVYLGALVTLAALVWWPSERIWPVTFFLFGPRWVFALPLLAVLPACALADRRLAAALGVAAALLAEPLFGWCVPWDRAFDRGGSEASVRVVTWNRGGGPAPGALGLMMAREAPDVIVLQESGREGIETPPGWHRHREGGMWLLSRFPILDTAVRDPKDMWDLAGSGAMVRYRLQTPLGGLDLTGVHLETPREGLESILRFGPGAATELVAKNRQREIEAQAARRWVDESPSPLRVVAGDFNTPVESHVFRDHWSGFRDCHSAAGWGFGFTKRTRRIGTRIDHVLAGPGLTCVSTRVGDRLGGDHAPVIADLRLAP